MMPNSFARPFVVAERIWRQGMRWTLGLVAIVMAPGDMGTAYAADLRAASKVEAVTVFPQGAEVQRLAKIRVEPGSHTVIFSDLPREAQPASIRVEGKASGTLTIGSVDSRVVSVPRTDGDASASPRRRIEDEIEKLRDERARIEAEKQAAETQRTFVGNLVQLPTRPAPQPGNAGGRSEDWVQVLGIISKELSIHISNIALADPKDGKPTRVGFKITGTGEDRKVVRIAKRSGVEIDG